MKVVDMKEARAANPDRPADWEPSHALKDALADIESGEVPAIKAIIILLEEDDEVIHQHRYFAGDMDKAESVGHLMRAVHELMG